MAFGDAHVFPGFLTPVLTQIFFPKPPTTFLTCFCRGERRKYVGKKDRLNRGQNNNHKVMSPTRSSLSHPGWAIVACNDSEVRFEKKTPTQQWLIADKTSKFLIQKPQPLQ